MTLDELAGLAEKATAGPYDQDHTSVKAPYEPGNRLILARCNSHADTAFIAAYDPGTVLKLIGVAKRAKEACFLLRHTELSPTTADRCEALDEALTALESL